MASKFEQPAGHQIRLGAELVEGEDEHPILVFPLKFRDPTMDETPVPKGGVRGHFQVGVLEHGGSPDPQLLLIPAERHVHPMPDHHDETDVRIDLEDPWSDPVQVGRLQKPASSARSIPGLAPEPAGPRLEPEGGMHQPGFVRETLHQDPIIPRESSVTNDRGLGDVPQLIESGSRIQIIEDGRSLVEQRTAHRIGRAIDVSSGSQTGGVKGLGEQPSSAATNTSDDDGK